MSLDLSVGKNVFICRHYSDTIEEFEVIKAPFLEHSIYTLIGLKNTSNSIYDESSLSDMGHPEHAYDDRPQQIWATREEAEANHQAAKDWWNKHRTRRKV